MCVLGIDSGFAATGYGVVERVGSKLVPVAMGVVRTTVNAPHPDRLVEIQEAIGSVIAEQRPDAAAVERVFFSTNVRTAMAVSQASGVAIATAAAAGLQVVEYTPTEVKASVVGVGTATKHQVQSMVAALLGLSKPPSPPDVADACALSICHLNRAGLSRALRKAEAR